MGVGMQSVLARGVVSLGVAATATFFFVSGAVAQVTAFKQALAEAAAKDRDIAAFYQDNGYAAIWTGNDPEDKRRRQELFHAIRSAEAHGLPVARYDAEGLLARMRDVRTARERGLVEVALSRTFLRLARDMQSGALVPSEVDSDIKREVAYRDRQGYLAALAEGDPRAFFQNLPPDTDEYARLMKEKIRLERLMLQGGWGPQVPVGVLKPGETGTAVVALRNRLMRMGYLPRSLAEGYDGAMSAAVEAFQADHGLVSDGVAGPETMAELNRPVEVRLQSVLVAMERERWLNQPRGARHVLVNLTDFSARIIDGDKVTFETRAVVGKDESGRRSPEFSDTMEYMVVNPTWNVPRSIAVKEYLPQLKRNRYAVSHLDLYDRRGRKVNRGRVNFRAFSERTFPFAIKQAPSQRNALGLVKFMFPNRYNIYLHDTPAKDLFAREKRDFSHGCIRLHEPFEFAYELLARQQSDPRGYFHARLSTGRETTISLDEPVPVHIIYRTAVTRPQGRTQYRGDVYGRDARIWDALARAGVSLADVRG